MKKNLRTQFQYPQAQQLHFDLDEANTHPTTSAQSIEIHIHSKDARENKSYRLKDSRGIGIFSEKRVSSHNPINHFAPNRSLPAQESQLKAQMAHQVLQWMIEDQLTPGDPQNKLLLSESKLTALKEGNLTKLSFYELLESLTQFGFNALICLRPSDKKTKGRILMEI
jgi:hypothetical protein